MIGQRLVISSHEVCFLVLLISSLSMLFVFGVLLASLFRVLGLNFKFINICDILHLAYVCLCHLACSSWKRTHYVLYLSSTSAERSDILLSGSIRISHCFYLRLMQIFTVLFLYFVAISL